MAERVAVYIDFDNVVISRYNLIHGADAWHKDSARRHFMRKGPGTDVAGKLADAKVHLGAIIDYATSFGVVAMTRAYADWSVPANAAYRHDLVSRAVDLVQLFPASGTKNGADIRLAVDAVEDVSRHPDITHIVLVTGDSDYVPLAQRCRKLGRTVVGVGVAGATSPAFVSACDEFTGYEKLPGTASAALAPRPKAMGGSATSPLGTVSTTATGSAGGAGSPEPDEPTALLVRAMRVARKDDDGWVYAAALKSQMQRMHPAFDEKALGFSSFRSFAESRSDVVDTKTVSTHQLLRLR